jgi:hypothetical protein
MAASPEQSNLDAEMVDCMQNSRHLGQKDLLAACNAFAAKALKNHNDVLFHTIQARTAFGAVVTLETSLAVIDATGRLAKAIFRLQMAEICVSRALRT